MRTDFWGNYHFTYGFFAVLFSEAFAVQRRHYLRKSRSKTGNGQTPESGLTSESQSIATLALSVVVSRCDKRSEIQQRIGLCRPEKSNSTEKIAATAL